MKLNECVDETKEASKTATADSGSINKFYLPEEYRHSTSKKEGRLPSFLG